MAKPQSKRKTSRPSNLETLDLDMTSGVTESIEDLEDDKREIKRLEKLLGLSKKWKRKEGKNKTDKSRNRKLPSTFEDMGLDFLLEPILNSNTFNDVSSDPENSSSEKQASESGASDVSDVEVVDSNDKEPPAKKKRSLYTEDAECVDSDSDINQPQLIKVKKRVEKSLLSDEVSNKLHRKCLAIMNRLSEPTVPPLFNEAKLLYSSGDFPRAEISNALCDAAMATCVTRPHFIVPYKVSSPVAIIFALLRATSYASDAVGQLIHRLAWKVVEYKKADNRKSVEIRSTPALENTLQLISLLLVYRCLDCFLFFDILQVFSDCIEQSECEIYDTECGEYAAKLAITLLRLAGPTLRKKDPSTLTEFILKLQSAAIGARNRAEVSSGSRLNFLTDVIAAVRNNNFAKIPGYNAEEIAKFGKLYSRLKNELACHDNVNEAPLGISLSTLEGFGESGSNWWLKADTCSGPMALKMSEVAMKKDTQKKEIVKKKSISSEEKKHNEMARKLHLNTEIRRSIFSVIISSNDLDEAVERLIKLPFRSEIQRTEVVPVAFQCCAKEKSYNHFYGQLIARICNQESDKKQRLFRLAVKKSFTERLNVTSYESVISVNNTAQLCVDLVRFNAISLITALRCVDFTAAAPGSPTYAFIHGLIDVFFHPSKLDEASFRRSVIGPLTSAKAKAMNGRKLCSSLVLFAKHLYDSGEDVKLAPEEDEELDSRMKKKEKIIKGCGKFPISELRPRIDLLQSEML